MGIERDLDQSIVNQGIEDTMGLDDEMNDRRSERVNQRRQQSQPDAYLR